MLSQLLAGWQGKGAKRRNLPERGKKKTWRFFFFVPLSPPNVRPFLIFLFLFHPIDYTLTRLTCSNVHTDHTLLISLTGSLYQLPLTRTGLTCTLLLFHLLFSFPSLCSHVGFLVNGMHDVYASWFIWSRERGAGILWTGGRGTWIRDLVEESRDFLQHLLQIIKYAYMHPLLCNIAFICYKIGKYSCYWNYALFCNSLQSFAMLLLFVKKCTEIPVWLQDYTIVRKIIRFLAIFLAHGRIATFC